MSSLVLEIYAGQTSTTLRPYHDELQSRATFGPYTTSYGGLYGTLEIFVTADQASPFQWALRDRVVVRDGLELVWEGVIATINPTIQDAQKGIRISCVGAKSLLERISINRRWADARIENDVWIPSTGGTGFDKFRSSRDGEIKIVPSADEFVAADGLAMVYAMPTGRTIARVTAASELSETAVWEPRQVRNNALTELDNAVDGDAATNDVITINTGQYIYIGSNREFDTVVFDFGGTVNANAATISGQYVAAQTHTWTALSSVSDGTAAAGKTFAVDGQITFTMPQDWAPDGLVGARMFWVRFTPSANLTANIVINEVTVGERQAWGVRIRDTVGATDIILRTANGSGAHDVNLGTPRQALTLQMFASVKQTGVSNGSVFGSVSSLVVYDKTTAPTVASVAIDIVTEATSVVNSDTSQIAANTYSLIPFMTNGPESILSVLDRAIAFGDASQNVWFWSLVDSEQATTPNGKPVLKTAVTPVLTDYDYAISLDDTNLLPPFELVLDMASIVNYVTLIYKDATTGREVVLTPDDDATLKDTDSITTYGRCEAPQPLSLPVTSAAAALNYGRVYLARYKNPQYLVSGPLRVAGHIRLKSGGELKASRITADGKRIRIENYLDDVGGVEGAGLTFLITGTSYYPLTDICEISTGYEYDDLALMLSRMESA